MPLLRLTAWFALGLAGSACLATTACGSQNYRLTLRGTVPVLTPPRARPVKRSRVCQPPAGPIPVERRSKSWQARPTAEALTNAPAGALAAWATAMQQANCVPAGEAYALAGQVAQSVPLPLGQVPRLLQPDIQAGYTDLHPGQRVRVISPIFRPGAPPQAEALENFKINGLSHEARASKDLLGYETAWYRVEPGALQLVTVEAQIEGKSIRSERSRFTYFPFLPSARLFRMLFLTRASTQDREALVLAAASESEIETNTRMLNEDPARCAQMPGLCVVLPPRVAMTVYVTVMVNGEEKTVPPASPLGALVPAGVRHLQVKKRSGGKLTPVDFQQAPEAILKLPLMGGEQVEWRRE
jgi:hypothetical protein